MKAKNTAEFIRLLNTHRAFLDALFDSPGHQMHINNAIGIAGYDAIQILEEYSIVEQFEKEIILDDKIALMLESYLIDGYDEDVLDYSRMFRSINDSINLYYIALENSSDIVKYLRDIQRLLKKIPGNIRDHLISIQHHINFVYSDTSSPKQKIQELVVHNKSLKDLEESLSLIRRENINLKGFAKESGDRLVQFYRIRLNNYIHDASATLLDLNARVVEYIRKTNENIRFYKHLAELVELAKRREIIDKTNIFEVVSDPKRAIYHSGYVAVERMNWQIKLSLDYNSGELERMIQRCGKKTEEIGMAEASADVIEIYPDEMVEVISAGFLLDGYLESDSKENLYEYIRLRLNDVDDEVLLENYLSAVVIGAKSLEFSDTDITIGRYRCLLAAKAL